MPITVSVDQTADLTTAVATGKLSLEEIQQAITDFYAGQPTRKVIIDIDGASATHFHANDLQTIIDAIRTHFINRPQARTAIVTSNDSDYGMVRMGEAYAHELPVELRAFRNRESADQWLNSA